MRNWLTVAFIERFQFSEELVEESGGKQSDEVRDEVMGEEVVTIHSMADSHKESESRDSGEAEIAISSAFWDKCDTDWCESAASVSGRPTMIAFTAFGNWDKESLIEATFLFFSAIAFEFCGIWHTIIGL